MNKQSLIENLKQTQTFFERGTSCFSEEHSEFSPVEGTFTVAQQVAHAAQSIGWFIDGAFRNNEFDKDWEGFHSDTTSLAAARSLFSKAIEEAVAAIESQTVEQLTQPIEDEVVMTGMPKFCIPGAIAEHTAHHRGALTVYARLLGMTPPMPYTEVTATA